MIDTALTAGAITPDDIERFRSGFNNNGSNLAALNAVTKTPVTQIAMNREAVTRINHVYSHLVPAGPATSQEKSGRCWLFAGTNLFRTEAAKRLNLEDFELSQSYVSFFDKLEKANFFLESILSTLDEPTDSRLISWLVQSPVEDGGQWDMFVNIIKKYGVVPKSIMPESESSSSTGRMNERITAKLRENAASLRRAYSGGTSISTLRSRKESMLAEVYKMLCIHLGVPPTSFEWQWRDKDKAFHRDGILTPQEFYTRYVDFDLDSLVCLIHCPMETTPFRKLYTVNFLGNMVDGYRVRYINVEMSDLKRAAIAQIKDQRSVWFGCDVGKCFDRDLGVMDTELYQFEPVYGTTFEMNKADRLDYGASLMTHAMVFTGVNLDDNGEATKWRVENSWGDKGGDKGFMMMTDNWFDEYNYEVVVDRKYVPEDILALLDTEATGLDPWHPMGSLASISE